MPVLSLAPLASFDRPFPIPDSDQRLLACGLGDVAMGYYMSGRGVCSVRMVQLDLSRSLMICWDGYIASSVVGMPHKLPWKTADGLVVSFRIAWNEWS